MIAWISPFNIQLAEDRLITDRTELVGNELL